MAWLPAPSIGRSLSRLQLGPALEGGGEFLVDGTVARLQRDGALQVALVEAAVGQRGAQFGLFCLECLDAAGQGFQLALVFVAELLFL